MRALAARLMWAVLGCTVFGIAARAATAGPEPSAQAARSIIVALADKPEPIATAGSTPRGYDGLPNYTGGSRAVSTAAELARDYALQEISAWTIEPLRLRCMLYEIPATADRDQLLARLRADRRVRLAQPQQYFETLSAADHTNARHGVRPAAAPGTYNDPYIGLQSGFAAIKAGLVQRWADGSGVRIALIDAGVDAGHPDLQGRIAEQRDFVANAATPVGAERHGTEVAGVIAAVANNGIGIVGIAPGARVLAYRACWALRAGEDPARCDTFTVAQALGAAITANARIINLSLGGPSDPLLEQLTDYAVKHGAIVVGAVPPDGRMDGFPVDVPGVIAVVSTGDPRPNAAVLVAPGNQVLTLEPDGHYDYASGSSLAAAHVSGAVALLLQIDPGLDARGVHALLSRSQHSADVPIDVCAAAESLRHRDSECGEIPAAARLGRAMH
ncbi:S8 family serine peptidase [Dokdonella soli]